MRLDVPGGRCETLLSALRRSQPELPSGNALRRAPLSRIMLGMRTTLTKELSRATAATVLILAGMLATGCKSAAPAASAGVNAVSDPAPKNPAARKALHQPFTPPPTVKKNLYPPIEEAAPDIARAETEARAEGKRVLLDFGGDWCGDCQVLDIYFHQEPNASLLNRNFVKVNVNVGHEDANIALARKYGVPLEGVPALAVLSPDGKLLTSQNKEFSDMRYMEPGSVTDFLNRWRPQPQAASSASTPSGS